MRVCDRAVAPAEEKAAAPAAAPVAKAAPVAAAKPAAKKADSDDDGFDMSSEDDEETLAIIAKKAAEKAEKVSKQQRTKRQRDEHSDAHLFEWADGLQFLCGHGRCCRVPLPGLVSHPIFFFFFNLLFIFCLPSLHFIRTRASLR